MGHSCREWGAAHHERGSVTAEFAIVLPAVVLVLVAVLLVAAAATAQVRCTDAARAGARAAALGSGEAQVAAIAADLAGEQAQVSVTSADGWVVVRVSAPVDTGPLGAAGLVASAEFSARAEPGSGP
ncbi:TadE family type IV pilus minor pilin [Occultella gossypii]|uniref:Pilus assembly protein n=1 Tax=Occultella gossypii TaxID=2800820 RepID=A0ABS7SAN5_9MICO|nr:TadE family type IV pilus minor pilin [Occultella gossypii]MBZ2197332.1 pilus assembly protein [Occultella gossypii]